MSAENFIAADKRKWDELNAADATAKAKGVIIDRYITHPMADGQAVYRITGATKTKATITHVDVGDGWTLPAWGKTINLPIKTVQGFLHQRDGLAALFARTDNWWSSQTLGTVVHYDNGFNEFVRGKIIDHEGEKKMLPIAMVGHGWNQNDIYRRSADGTVHHGFHALGIINQTPMQPNASNMVEYPEHRLRPGVKHPRDLEPLLLTPPAMTPEQTRLANLAKFHAEVVAALSFSHDADPVKLAYAMTEALRNTKHLLRNI